MTREPDANADEARGGRGLSGLLLKLLRAKDYRINVLEKSALAPTMLTARFEGREFLELVNPSGGEFVRCWFPTGDGRKQVQRGYTICDIDLHRGEFSMHFLLHQPPGPASRGAAAAEVGAQLVITSFGSHPFEMPVPPPETFILLADAASLPYAAEIAARVPDEVPVQLWIQEYCDSDRKIPLLPQHAGVSVRWLPGGAEAAVAAFRDADLCGCAVSVAAEVGVVRAVRRELLANARLPKGRLQTHGYWIAGREFS